MSFENIIGNDDIKETLNKLVEGNKIIHSYMFIGPSGIGKVLFAKEFAKMILCENTFKKPCNNCKSCIELENNNNPDLVEITPENRSIKIEKIREMQEKIQELPIISNKKVYIIKDADLMTTESQNCLLKTLEEPPSFITIIMTGSNESMFLTTIKSRCMKIQFHRIDDKLLNDFIEEKYSIKLDNNLVKACEGSIEKAILVNEKKEEYEKIISIFSNIENYKLIDAINKLDFMYQDKENIYNILNFINIILCNKLIEKPGYIKYIETVEQTKKNIKANANYDMSIDNMIYKIWEE